MEHAWCMLMGEDWMRKKERYQRRPGSRRAFTGAVWVSVLLSLFNSDNMVLVFNLSFDRFSSDQSGKSVGDLKK